MPDNREKALYELTKAVAEDAEFKQLDPAMRGEVLKRVKERFEASLRSDTAPGAFERFAAPFTEAAKGVYETYKPFVPPVLKALPERRYPTLREVAETVLIGPRSVIESGKLAYRTLKAIPEEVIAAAGEPTPGERSIRGVAALLPGMGPTAVEAGKSFGTGDIAGGISRTGLALAPVAVGRIVTKGSPLIERAAGRIRPFANKLRENAGLQKVVRDLASETGEAAELRPFFQRAAKAEVSALRVVEAQKKTFEAITQAAEEFEASQVAKAKEQAYRVTSSADVSRLARDITGAEEVNPIVAAREANKALLGQKAFQDTLEHKLYSVVDDRATALGVEVLPQQTAAALRGVVSVPSRAQAQLGVSTLAPSDISGLRKMQTGIQQPASVSRAPLQQLIAEEGMQMREFLELPENEQTALLRLMEGSPEPIPFAVADNAQQGLGKLTRSMRQADNPEYASRIFALERVHEALKNDIREALKGHPDISEPYQQAHRLTFEQHDVIDRKFIRGFFREERYRTPAENIIRNVLKPGTVEFQEILWRGLTPGTETEAAIGAIGKLDPKFQVELASKLRDVVVGDEAAKAGMRRAVLDEMIKIGTKPSETPGVTAPQINFNRMASFLRDRPGTKVLLGDEYGGVLRKVETGAQQQLAQSNPAYDAYIQAVTRSTGKLGEVIEKAATKPEIPRQLLRMVAASDEGAFVRRIISDQGFRERAARMATPGVRDSVIRSLIDKVTSESVIYDEWGSDSGLVDPVAFGRGFDATYPALRTFGDPRAARLLKDMAHAAQKQSLRSRAGRRALLSLHERLLTLGRVGLNLREYTGRNQMPIGPREIAKAVQSPELARMLREAAEMPVSDPRAGALASGITTALGLQAVHTEGRK